MGTEKLLNSYISRVKIEFNFVQDYFQTTTIVFVHNLNQFLTWSSIVLMELVAVILDHFHIEERTDRIFMIVWHDYITFI